MPKDKHAMGYGNPHKQLPAPKQAGYMPPGTRQGEGLKRPTFPAIDTSKGTPSPGMPAGGKPKTHGY